MYTDYDDIVRRVADQPVWWDRGLPRFDPFMPNVLAPWVSEVALVHTECQGCGRRFDVAVHDDHPYSSGLRAMIAYQGTLSVGDAPFHAIYGLRCTGVVMGSIQVAVLEFWESKGAFEGWARDPSLEHPLVYEGSASDRIYSSDRKADWIKASREGNFDEMVAILEAVGCNHAMEVAHVLDVQRRRYAFSDDMIQLGRGRLAR